MFKFLLQKLFFNRRITTIVCVLFVLLSLVIDFARNSSGVWFSASGSLLTISGLLLSVKLNYLSALSIEGLTEEEFLALKCNLVNGAGKFGSRFPNAESIAKLREVESDEIWGATLIIFGTLLWGYGGLIFEHISKMLV